MDEPKKPPLPADACCNEQPSFMTPKRGLAGAGAEMDYYYQAPEDDQVLQEQMRDEQEREDRGNHRDERS